MLLDILITSLSVYSIPQMYRIVNNYFVGISRELRKGREMHTRKRIKEAFEKGRKTYAPDRIVKELRKSGEKVGRQRWVTYMAETCYYLFRIYPSALSSSAISTAPPAAPRSVLCERHTNL